MPQTGIPYILTGPDGSRAVFNDPTDPDFIGYLDPENGITGLLDTADVRESVTDHVEAHGASQGNNWFGRRVGTLQGIIWPDPDINTVLLREDKIKKASRGMKALAPATFSWTPAGSVARKISVWRQGNIRLTGRRPKNFLIPLASPDAYNFSAAQHSQILTPGGTSGDAGVANPLMNPIQTVYQVNSQLYIANAGDVETPPIFQIRGPVTNPTLLNNTTGLQWTLTYVLQSTDIMTVDTKNRTVMLGTANRYSAYAANFPSNTWWPLEPGANDVRFLSASFSAGAQVTVLWNDAWE